MKVKEITGRKGCSNNKYCENGKSKPTEELIRMRQRETTEKIYRVAFQMFQVFDPYLYSQAAEEGYTDFPGGDNADYMPRIPGIKYNGPSVRPAIVGVGDVFGLANDFLLGYRPTYLKKTTPFDQLVYLSYVTTYHNIPSVNASKEVSLTGVQIHNSSKRIDKVIDYTLHITSGENSITSNKSAATNSTAIFTLTTDLNITNNIGGIDILIKANTFCSTDCITMPNSPDFVGYVNLVCNP